MLIKMVMNLHIDYRFSVVSCVLSLLLFAWAFVEYDLYGVVICGISAITNFVSAIFSYSFNPLVKHEQRQTLIETTLGK